MPSANTESNSHILDAAVAHNRLLRLPLSAMRLVGYAIFDHQITPWAHNWRGIVLSVLFVVFNATQFVDMANYFGELDEMTTNASNTLLFTTTVLRMYLFYRNRLGEIL